MNSAILSSVKLALEKKARRRWPKLYWAIDVHGVLFKSNYNNNQKDFSFYSRYEVEFLRYLSSRKDCVLILWTSSHAKDISEYLEFLKNLGICFDYVNSNPECQSTDISDFTSKFYFDILLDDKAGFDPERDWHDLFMFFNKIERESKTETLEGT